ncbi:MAG: glycosyltransferase family 2 protein [bacterium]|nr:glycosyltransferase family 2 protein [bacterium]
MPSKIDLSIIILSYNTQHLLKNCLSTVIASKKNGFVFEVIVVDNASIDESCEMIKNEFPSVRLVRNSKNYGYAKGNNIGMKAAFGRFILLLNSDTEVCQDTFVKMIEFIENKKKAGLVTCQVEMSDGKMDPACHRGFPTPWASLTYMFGLEKIFPESKLFGQYHQTFKDFSKPHQIDATTGAFSLIRKEVLEEVGYLDEDYFMYGEDLDWAYRIKKLGWEVWYNPDVKIIHFKKQSGREKKLTSEETHKLKHLRKTSTNHFYNTMKIFYKKHYQDQYSHLLTSLVLLGIEVKRRLTLLRISL